MKGTVKWFNTLKGYGFIAGEDGNDIFVHQTGIQMDGFRKLPKDASVEYDISHNANGQTIAVNVKQI